MSIKGFHLIFIAIASLFCAGFGVWALFLDEQSSGLGVKAFWHIHSSCFCRLNRLRFLLQKKIEEHHRLDLRKL
jgi:hypothetical protein